MVGRDGAVGIASAMDGKIAMSRAIVQLGGEAFICDPKAFKQTAMQSAKLIGIVMRHEQTLFAQAQQSTACMANHDVEARLCRWMLRARDLCGSNHLPFTQEFLAEMLGVRRTSVTTVAKTLQQSGIINYKRGRIEILNVEDLKDSACESYETVKDQYRQLIIEAIIEAGQKNRNRPDPFVFCFSMTRYFFDIRRDDELITDDEGVELPDTEAAEHEAILSLAEMARDKMLHKGSFRRIAIEVRDPEKPVLATRLIWEIQRHKSD